MEVISTEGISVAFRPEGGMIDDLVIACEGARDLRPLHRAPWVRAGEDLPDDVAPIEKRLAGDFFCAPFGQSGPDIPIHGWAANGTWEKSGNERSANGAVTATYRLRQAIEGARLTKHITLCPGHPIVYQSHVFEGGAGHIPVAHHAMLHVPGGAQLSFSSKASGLTPRTALETDPQRGRSILAYPQEFDSLQALRRADGAACDASLYPFDERHEDLVIMGEKPGIGLGWSAALAVADGFLFFAVKDASYLPHTVLWMSNGGRFYPPWNGRHRAVIGIEEASLDSRLIESPKSGDGDKAMGLLLGEDRITTIRYALGAIPAPEGWTSVRDIRFDAGEITLIDVGGDSRAVPFFGRHFDGLL